MKTDPIKEKILIAAEKRMIRFGFRKVTMDEIAADLSMSKNTIYKHFQSKEEIAHKIFERLRQRINAQILRVEQETPDPLAVISQNIMFIQKELSPWFEHLLGDIKVELPDLWKNFTTYRTEKILEIENLVTRGIKKGSLRRVNSTIAVRAFLGAVDAIINPEFLQHENISFEAALEEVSRIWETGLVKK